MNIMIEMTALSLSRPSPDAPRSVAAAWYERKARLHEQLVQDGTDAEHERVYAAIARAHALTLRTA
ncbi:hypothetical protein [Antrihabitans sp. YC2-6]|uniref:hypothetical protein n=1 Tax=Antrihabitans sp. YC2-6 TaxID=2799498 RepID=UPI0018F35F41|nr:hypothetical protein [Antrihabitans sp. YC2-6]MBJ8348416.1 hypothetical protein [Antrihabitans sp. YC2-6]